jgi:hypothetical protein
MRGTVLIIGCVMLGMSAVTWIAGRLVERAQYVLAVVSGVVIRAGLAACFGLIAAGLAIDGGYGWIPVPILALLALWNVALIAGILRVAVREAGDSDAEPR